MTSYNDRLKELKSAWNKTKAASGKSFAKVPEGRYQAEVTQAKVDWKTLRVNFSLKIKRGDQAGQMANRSINLDYQGTNTVPSGLAMFKGDLEVLGINIPEVFDEKAVPSMLAETLGSLVEITVKHKGGYVNTYLNSLVHADEEDEGVDDVEFEEEEDEEEEETPKKKAPQKKKAVKKKEPEPEEDEDDEDFDDFDDFDDLDED